MNAIMNNFKDFCDEITNIVEQKVISWHGCRVISHEQVIELDVIKMHIAEKLFNNTIKNSLTYVFGG